MNTRITKTPTCVKNTVLLFFIVLSIPGYSAASCGGPPNDIVTDSTDEKVYIVSNVRETYKDSLIQSVNRMIEANEIVFIAKFDSVFQDTNNVDKERVMYRLINCKAHITIKRILKSNTHIQAKHISIPFIYITDGSFQFYKNAIGKDLLLFSNSFPIDSFSFSPGCYSHENAFYVNSKNRVSNPRIAFGHSMQLPRVIDTTGNFIIDNIIGTWRWIQSHGGIWGVKKAKESDSVIVTIKKDSVHIYNKDSLIYANTSQKALSEYYYFKGMDIADVDDTLYASQPPRCCDIPYLYVFERIKINTSQKINSLRAMQSTRHSGKIYQTFDIRGRTVIKGKQMSHGLFILKEHSSKRKQLLLVP